MYPQLRPFKGVDVVCAPLFCYSILKRCTDPWDGSYHDFRSIIAQNGDHIMVKPGIAHVN